MESVEIGVQQLDTCKSLPVYATEGSAGLDLSVSISNPVSIEPGEILKLPTGVIFDIPEGYFGLFVPRSGTAFRAGITLINSPGIVDSDWVLESMFLLVNHGKSTYVVQPGERLGQMIFLPYPKVKLKIVESVESRKTRTGGLGSTGTTVVINHTDNLTTHNRSGVNVVTTGGKTLGEAVRAEIEATKKIVVKNTYEEAVEEGKTGRKSNC
jgi:dUTP pyrophosphatase